jgi:hypothetical protein
MSAATVLITTIAQAGRSLRVLFGLHSSDSSCPAPDADALRAHQGLSVCGILSAGGECALPFCGCRDSSQNFGPVCLNRDGAQGKAFYSAWMTCPSA